MADVTQGLAVPPRDLAEVQEGRRAALNLMEDAIRARDLADDLNRQLRDEITERNRTEALLQGQKAALEMVARDAPLADVLEFLARAVESHSRHGTRTAIHLLNPEHTRFTSAAAPTLPAEYLAATEDLPIDPGIGPCGDAVLSGDVVVVSDVAGDSRFPRFAEFAPSCGIGAGWSTPIFSAAGEILGTFAVYYGEPGRPSGQDQQLLGIVTHTVALAIEHRRAAETRARLSAIVESSNEAIFSTDLGGVITSWNGGAERLFGYTIAEAVGQNVALLAPASPDAATAPFDLRSAAPIGDRHETVIRCHDQTTRDVSVTVSPLRGEHGQLIGTSSVVHDITESTHLREALLQADRRKDEFLAMLGHELRNPLAAILTALELMKIRGADLFRRERDVIERQIRHVSRLVDDMLDITRITRGKVSLERQPVEVAVVIARAIEMTEPLIHERGHRLHVDVAPTGLVVDADAGRLSQVFANVLTNAARYTEPGGRIEVTSTRIDQDAVVDVTDTGAGLSAEFLPRVFDLFVQGARSADRPEGGLGLGLALVQSLVRLHGGSVSAHSEGLGKGSRFRIRLPLSRGDGAAHEDGVRGESPRHLSDSRTRILLIDDNVDAADCLGDILAALGHEVAVVYDGPRALGALESFEADIAFVDLGLPGMDGYELVQRIREVKGRRAPRFIAMTGYGQPKDVARSRQAGFEEHLVKPVDIEALTIAIDGAGRFNPRSAQRTGGEGAGDDATLDRR
jgi:PAS domain S-box-containing protein